MYTPLTVGGGIKTEDHVRKLLRAGADKICLGSARYDYDLIESLANMFGSQCITVSIDAYNSVVINRVSAKDAENAGAGEILLQSIPRDGTMRGYDMSLITEVTSAVSIPVVASGGCSGYEDMYNAIQAGASAVAAGALFQFTDCTPRGAAEYLQKSGVEVRL
jgi:cyclase